MVKSYQIALVVFITYIFSFTVGAADFTQKWRQQLQTSNVAIFKHQKSKLNLVLIKSEMNLSYFNENSLKTIFEINSPDLSTFGYQNLKIMRINKISGDDVLIELSAELFGKQKVSLLRYIKKQNYILEYSVLIDKMTDNISHAKNEILAINKDFDPWFRNIASSSESESDTEASSGCKDCSAIEMLLGETALDILHNINSKITPQCEVQKLNLVVETVHKVPGVSYAVACEKVLVKSAESLVHLIFSLTKVALKSAVDPVYRASIYSSVALVVQAFWSDPLEFSKMFYSLFTNAVMREVANLQNCSKEYREAFACEVALTALGGAALAKTFQKMTNKTSNKPLTDALDFLAKNETDSVVKKTFSDPENTSLIKAELPILKAAIKFEPGHFKNIQMKIWQAKESGDAALAKELTAQVEQEFNIGKIISNEKIVDNDKLGIGISGARLITFESGLKGVWKTFDNSFNQNGAFEIAAYKIDRKLGLNDVPITTHKYLGRSPGTVQLYIENTDKVDLIQQPEHMHFLDYLIHNNDRNPKNYLIYQGRPVAIDNGFAFREKLTNLKPPNFTATLDNYIKPVEELRIKSDVLRHQIEHTKSEYGVNSSQYKSVFNKLQPELEEAVRLEKIKTAKNFNSVSIALPEKSVYLKLKSTSDKEWAILLNDHLNNDLLAQFLRRKNKVIEACDRAIKTFGKDVLREGQVSPFTAKTEVKVRVPVKPKIVIKPKAPVFDEVPLSNKAPPLDGSPSLDFTKEPN